jgi:segregation and condensation protein B
VTMDEQEKELTPDIPVEDESGAAVAPPQDGAEETTGEAYSDADRRAEADESAEHSEQNTSAAALDQPADQNETPLDTGAERISVAVESAEGTEALTLPADETGDSASVPRDSEAPEGESFTADEILMGMEQPAQIGETNEAELLAILEAIVYITDEPLSAKQIADALVKPLDYVKSLLDKLVDEFSKSHHGLTVKEVAGGYKITTKPEHHEAVRAFVKNLNPPLKLSLAALETLAVIAYKQPITAPEIMEIRGVQGAGVLKTLLDRKLITSAGRKNVVGKPILYKTTKEFLVQFGLRDLNELPSLKEFEDLRRFAFSDADEAPIAAPDAAPAEAAAEATTHE